MPKQGSPARYARVNCVPQSFNMAKENSLDEAFVTVADSLGFYSFDSVPGESFSLEAVHDESGNRLLVRDVSQDVHTLDRTLEQPGVAFIPAGLDAPDSSVVLVTSPGTTILRKAMVIGGSVFVDSLPRSDLELHVLFDTEEVVLEQITIVPGDTVWVAERTPVADSLPEKADEGHDSLQPAVFTYVAPLALKEGVRPGLDSLDDFPMAVRLNLVQDEMDSLDKRIIIHPPFRTACRLHNELHRSQFCPLVRICFLRQSSFSFHSSSLNPVSTKESPISSGRLTSMPSVARRASCSSSVISGSFFDSSSSL